MNQKWKQTWIYIRKKFIPIFSCQLDIKIIQKRDYLAYWIFMDLSDIHKFSFQFWL